MSDANMMVQPVSLDASIPVMAPNLAAVPQQIPRLGDAPMRFSIRGLDRNSAGPEDANADFALADPNVYHQSALLQVDPVIFLQGGGSLISADYNVLSNYQAFRDGQAFVNAAGRNDQTEIPMWTADNITFQANAICAPNWVLGVVIEWSLQLQVSSPFTLELWTENFSGQSWQDLNRHVFLRLGPQGQDANNGYFANGGMICLLFAQRATMNDACGCLNGSGCTSIGGTGGMMKAFIQPAWIAPENPPDYYGAAGELQFAPYIGGLTTAMGSPDRPIVYAKVNASVGVGFGAVTRYLTTASPQLAGVQGRLRSSGYGLVAV